MDSTVAKDELRADPLIASIETTRKKLINTLLLAVVLIGIPLYLISAIPLIKGSSIPSLIIFWSLIIWIISMAFLRKAPYLLRASSIVILPFVLGILNLSQSGLNIASGFYLLTFSILAGLMFGFQIGIYALITSTVMISGFGFLITTKLHPLAMALPQESIKMWIMSGTIFLFSGVIIIYSATSLINSLHQSLGETKSILEQTLEEREHLEQSSASTEKRFVAIRTSAEISRMISGILDPKRLLQEVVEVLKDRFQLYYVGVFLIDEQQRHAILEAGTGEAGQELILEKHKLPINETSMIGWAISRSQARIALDVGKDAIRFANPHLPLTRSELALPIASRKTLGALSIQSDKEAAFDQDDIAVLQGIADTLAVALENARLFRELEHNLNEIQALHGQYVSSAWAIKTHKAGPIQFISNTSIMPSEDTKSIRVPVALRDQVIGQLILDGNDEWTRDERALIEAVASQAALALESARLLEDSQQIALRERLTAEITNKIWALQNVDGILQTTIGELGRVLRADEATIEIGIKD